MGIYDRDYYGGGGSGRSGRRMGPAGQWSGMGQGRGFSSPKTWSVTIWLIVINSAIFFLGAFPPLNQPHFLPAARVIFNDVPESTLDRSFTDKSLIFPVQTEEGESLFAYPIVATVASGETPTRLQRDLERRPLLGPNGELLEAVGQSVVYPVPGGLLGAYGHFSTFQGFVRLEVWRLVTFQFLHANFIHLLFNMIGLWIFGGMVEQFLGKKRYLAFYLMCGISGGLLYLLLNGFGLLNISLPGALDVNWRTSLVGASAGVFGVIVACAKISPNTVIQLLFPPIPLKIRTLAYAYVAFAAFNLFINKGANQGGDAAHIGGAIAGFFFIRNTHLLRDFFDVFGKSSSSKTGPSKKKSAKTPKRARGEPEQEEVDRILAKVSTNGLQSLTDKEKKLLERASRAKRDGS